MSFLCFGMFIKDLWCEELKTSEARDEVTLFWIEKIFFYDYSFNVVINLHLIFLVSECLSICVDALL